MTTKQTTDRDVFGSKVGTQCNLINETLLKAKRGLTVAELAEKTGLSNKRCRNHLEHLRRKGFLNWE